MTSFIERTQAYHDDRLSWEDLVTEAKAFPWKRWPALDDDRPVGEDPADLEAATERILGKSSEGTTDDLLVAQQLGYLSEDEEHALFVIAWEHTSHRSAAAH